MLLCIIIKIIIDLFSLEEIHPSSRQIWVYQMSFYGTPCLLSIIPLHSIPGHTKFFALCWFNTYLSNKSFKTGPVRLSLDCILLDYCALDAKLEMLLLSWAITPDAYSSHWQATVSASGAFSQWVWWEEVTHRFGENVEKWRAPPAGSEYSLTTTAKRQSEGSERRGAARCGAAAAGAFPRPPSPPPLSTHAWMNRVDDTHIHTAAATVTREGRKQRFSSSM